MALKTQGLQTPEQIHALLEGTAPLGFEVPRRAVAHDWITAEPRRFRYDRLDKADKGLLRHYLAKVTGVSRAQMTRLIAQLRARGHLLEDEKPREGHR